MSAHVEGTAPTYTISGSRTWPMAEQSPHHTLCFQLPFCFQQGQAFIFRENASICNWEYPLPLVPMPGTVSLCLFPTPLPLLSLAFPEAFPPPFNDFLDFSFALCYFSFAASWGPRLKPRYLLFPLLILLFLFPSPFSQSNTRKKCLE